MKLCLYEQRLHLSDYSFSQCAMVTNSRTCICRGAGRLAMHPEGMPHPLVNRADALNPDSEQASTGESCRRLSTAGLWGSELTQPGIEQGCTLHADARYTPWGSAAMLKMWLACPYSLKTSGQSVFCARCSSRGGPATADGMGFGARSGPCVHVTPP